MSSAGRVLLGVVKWVVVPAALGFAGYYFIGPQFSKAAPIELRERVANALTPDAPSGPKFSPPSTDTDEKISTKFKPPKVKVSVLSATGRTRDDESTVRYRDPDAQPRRTRKKRNPTTTVPSEPDQSQPSAPNEPTNDTSQ